MAQAGDTVRFLNSTGGGRITRIEGRIAYVEEDGFETPVLVNELVVVLPAGHEPAVKGSRLMFDQKGYDEGKKSARVAAVPEEPKRAPEPENLPVEETERGEKINVVLGFEPVNIKTLSTTDIAAVLINDSNYYLSFSVMVRDMAAGEWRALYQGEVAPNESIDIAVFRQENIAEIERIVFQGIAYKKGKPFSIKFPMNVSRKIDVTKFFKVHCFRPGVYLEKPSIEIPLYSER